MYILSSEYDPEKHLRYFAERADSLRYARPPRTLHTVSDPEVYLSELAERADKLAYALYRARINHKGDHPEIAELADNLQDAVDAYFAEEARIGDAGMSIIRRAKNKFPVHFAVAVVEALDIYGIDLNPLRNGGGK